MYTLGAFIDLDTADPPILLKKLVLYGVRGNNHNWIKSLLLNRKQYIEIDPTTETNFELVKCGAPQGPILAPLLFLLYVNDLKNASSLLDPTIFADDKNLFYTYKNIHCLFSDGNKELTNKNKCFVDNKTSLNVEKNNYSFSTDLVRKTIFLFNYQI